MLIIVIERYFTQSVNYIWNKKEVDLMTVAEKLRSMKMFAPVGGAPYLAP